jgi:hypothetical protein
MSPVAQTFLGGIKRCLTSASCQAAFGAVVVSDVTIYFSWPTLSTPAAKSAAIIALLALIGVLARDIIAGFAAENVASIHADAYNRGQEMPGSFKGN